MAKNVIELKPVHPSQPDGPIDVTFNSNSPIDKHGPERFDSLKDAIEAKRGCALAWMAFALVGMSCAAGGTVMLASQFSGETAGCIITLGIAATLGSIFWGMYEVERNSSDKRALIAYQESQPPEQTLLTDLN